MKIIENIIKQQNWLGDVGVIVYKNTELLYSDYVNKINYCSTLISQCSTYKPQIPVVIFMERSIEFMIAIIAVLNAGCYYVPIEKPFPKNRLKEIINSLENCILFTDNTVDIPINKSCVVINLKNCDAYDNSIQYNFSSIEANMSDTFYIMFTSGSNGKPKGINITYESIINLEQSLKEGVYKNVNARKNIALLASFSFDASVKQLIPNIFWGHKLFISEKNDRYFGRKLMSFLCKNSIHIIDMTPSILRILDLCEYSVLVKLEKVLIGGEILYWELISKNRERLNFCDFYNMYGPTECCADVAYYKLPNSDRNKGIVPVGYPILNTRLLVMDDNNMVQGKGELIIVGKPVGNGYINHCNNAFFDYEGQKAYRTGDIAFIDDSGAVVIVGRMNRQVKLNGFRIELDDISQTISNLLHGSGVYVDIIKANNDYLVAFLEGVNEQIASPQFIIKSLKEYLPQYMIPKKYIYLKHFPLTVNGKLDIKALLNSIVGTL